MARGGRRRLPRLGNLRGNRRTGHVAPFYPDRMARDLLRGRNRPLGGARQQAELAAFWFGLRLPVIARFDRRLDRAMTLMAMTPVQSA